ncbi:MAG: hypothetical protein ACRCYR_03580 [Phycicoccus sp.]
MKINLLVMQRKGHPTGQYLPEVLAVVDEVTLDDNPDWWDSEKREQLHRVGDDVDAWAEVTLDVAETDLARALYPQAAASTSRPERVDGSHLRPDEHGEGR